MNLQISIYDFFSHTIPGIIYLLAFYYFYALLYSIQLSNYLSYNPSIGIILLLGVIAYLIGFLMDGVVRRSWWRIFTDNKVVSKSIETIKKEFPDIVININQNQITTIRSFITQNCKERLWYVDKNGASHCMLRNGSFGIFLLSMIEFYLSITNFILIHWLILIFLIILTIISLLEARKYKRWYYQEILETFIAFN